MPEKFVTTREQIMQLVCGVRKHLSSGSSAATDVSIVGEPHLSDPRPIGELDEQLNTRPQPADVYRD